MLIICYISLYLQYGKFVPQSSSMGSSIQKINFSINDWGYTSNTLHTSSQKIHPFNEYGAGKNITVFFGDSNMEQYWPRVEKLMLESQERYHLYTTVFATSSGIFPLPPNPVKFEGTEIQKLFLNQAVDYIKTPEVKTVVFAAAWVTRSTSLKETDLKHFELLLKELNHLGKKVYLILSIPIDSRQDPNTMINRNLFSSRSLLSPWVTNLNTHYSSKLWFEQAHPITARLKQIAYLSGATIIDPVESLCTNGHCIILRNNGTPCYMDISHLTASCAREQATFIDQILTLK